MKGLFVKGVKTLIILSFLFSFHISPAFAQETVDTQGSDNVQVDLFANDQIVTKNVSTGEITTQAIPEVPTQKNSLSNFSPAYIPEGNQITPNPVDEIKPFSVIGTDERTEMSPYIWGIAFLEIHWPNGQTSRGTGFFISDDVLATAGHCVYNSSKGGWASSISVSPSIDGSYAPFGTVQGTYFHTSDTYISEGTAAYDYGVIEVGNNLGSQTGYFGYGVESSIYGLNVTITGYPGDHLKEQWTASGTITSSNYLYYRIYYAIDTESGQSGAPVYKSGNIAVGIHTDGTTIGNPENSGVRFTSSLKNWLDTFRN
ncbi:serine protease [Paenibacillus sp. YN15]|uniref:trypsin-like serine peptidase n=1 Tax=Paenibacillus sp. YN15 TaxID=1742774 RepID=UPI000DCE5BFF|nr:trypsin-like peptidase domain-containing protein [Paenibacillus sp. YN15]RAU96861.1 hypothetical protein DQG13_20130 [Paenibacillus sp. YN15]